MTFGCKYAIFNKRNNILSKVVLIIFGIIEIAFLYVNLFKFVNGGYVTLIISGLLMFLMYIWLHGSNIKRRYAQWVKISSFKEQFKALKEDESVPLFCQLQPGCLLPTGASEYL